MPVKAKIPMIPVSSSAMTHVGHVGTTLHVRFPSGRLYEYAGVSPETYAGLLKAKSIGSHFQTQIRGRYQEREITQ